MQFTKLRLHGFKSFVDAVELLIEPGLTGIVGPNGCGKSNLVEALQWVMGETSARRLRGGEMDDVIFGGTSTRPARNVATVGLVLDNRMRRAPAALNDGDEIEVERRLDRGKGSSYRVNGREVRARDVQMLFADAASGAQSSALIGQGRIGWLIHAKPTERRSLLEEAAGIGGLHARRHEAEMRLSAAEANLTRLGDVKNTLTQQIERVGRQVKQAEKYRALAEAIQKAEAVFLYAAWQDQDRRVKTCAERVAAAEKTVTQKAHDLALAEAARLAAQETLPALREKNQTMWAASEEIRHARDQAMADRTRAERAIVEAKARLKDLDHDLVREAGLAEEARVAVARIDARMAEDRAAGADYPAKHGAAETKLEALRETLSDAEQVLAVRTARLAARAAEQAQIERRLALARDRKARLERALAEATARVTQMTEALVDPARLQAALDRVGEARLDLARARQNLDREEAGRAAAAGTLDATRPVMQAADRTLVRLKAEIDALQAVLRGGDGGDRGVMAAITVTPGYENALAAALGDDLQAGLVPGPGAYFSAGIDRCAGPECLADTVPLGTYVAVPPALAYRLAHIAVLADGCDGSDRIAALRPGQQLVRCDGASWRWDGLVVPPGAPSAAARRLAERNRLTQKIADARTAEAAFADAEQAFSRAEAAFRRADDRCRAARSHLQQATGHLTGAEQAKVALDQRQVQAQTRHQAAIEAAEKAESDLAEALAAYHEMTIEQAGHETEPTDPSELARLKERVATLRAEERTQGRLLDTVIRDEAERSARLAALAAERAGWVARADGVVERLATLRARQEVAEASLADLERQPMDLAVLVDRLDGELVAARAAGDGVAEALTQAEKQAEAALGTLDRAQAAHGRAREDLVRAEAAAEQALEARTGASVRARGAFGCPAEQLPRTMGVPVGRDPRSLATLEQGLEQLKKERDGLGAVNLAAETELAAMRDELGVLETESADLMAAIAKLREGIGHLNKDGSMRLLAAFDQVNGHFTTLFTRLFGGGRAHLVLTDHEPDPLSAGLEIMASPPGKKMQNLTLLSGGERALTALALVFAVFLTNPAPVCVLDEVDAPLDDANVERFCHLVSEIGARTGTRFLIITHHRVSMARMDRLYGVTMMEKGISALVSVHLAEADRMIKAQ